MTRVRIDAGRLMAQLASAFIYCCMPQLRLSHMCHRERGVRGVSSVVCYAVLCHGRVRACNVCIQRVPWYVVVRPGYTLLSRLPTFYSVG